MTAIRLDGKTTRDEIFADLSERVDKLRAAGAVGTLVGADEVEAAITTAPTSTRGDGPPTVRWVVEKHSSSSSPAASNSARASSVTAR